MGTLAGIGTGYAAKRASDKRRDLAEKQLDLETRRVAETETRGNWSRSGYPSQAAYEADQRKYAAEDWNRQQDRRLRDKKLETDYLHALSQGDSKTAFERSGELIRQRGHQQGMNTILEETVRAIRGMSGGGAEGMASSGKMNDLERKQFELLMNDYRSANSYANSYQGVTDPEGAKKRVAESRQAIQDYLTQLSGSSGTAPQAQGAPSRGAGPQRGQGVAGFANAQRSYKAGDVGEDGKPLTEEQARQKQNQADIQNMLMAYRSYGKEGLRAFFSRMDNQTASEMLKELATTVGLEGGLMPAEYAELEETTHVAEGNFREGIQNRGYGEDPEIYGEATLDAASARDSMVGPVLPGGFFAAAALARELQEKRKIPEAFIVRDSPPELTVQFSQNGDPDNGERMMYFIEIANSIFNPPDRRKAASQGFAGPDWALPPEPILDAKELYARIMQAARDQTKEWKRLLSEAQRIGVGDVLSTQEQLLASARLGAAPAQAPMPPAMTANDDLGMRLHQQGIQARLNLLQNVQQSWMNQLQAAGQ